MNSDERALTFRVLSEAQIERVYRATLECLDRTGVNVLNAEGRALLAAAGARVDGVRVRIPPPIIQDAIAATPRTFTIWGRDSRHRMRIEPGRVYFGPGPSCTYFVDPQTGERRAPRRGDPGLTALVSDALENIDYVMGLATPGDVPPELAPVYEFAEMVAHTGKPLMAWAYTPDNIRDIHAIASAAAGSEHALREKPLFALFACSQPVLIHPDDVLANVFWAAEHGIPIVYEGGGSSGVTAPVTGAATLVISLAACLSGLAMIQLKKRGTPVCIGSVPAAADPRTVRPSYGGPELSLYSAALAEIARHLGLSFMGTAGASEAKTLDLQAAIESTLQVVISELSGTTMPHDVGMLDCADIGSLEMLVMNDEIISATRRVTRGIEVNDDTLMLDLIDEVGPGGEFLSCPETASRYRREIWMPKLMDRQPWAFWEKAGARSMLEAIRARVQCILGSHTPPPLPPGASEQIQAILRAAEERLAGAKSLPEK